MAVTHRLHTDSSHRCIGEPGNQRPIAEKGAIPHLLIILEEPTHPHSIKEAAAEALALLAYESAGGPAQEILTQLGGVSVLSILEPETPIGLRLQTRSSHMPQIMDLEDVPAPLHNATAYNR